LGAEVVYSAKHEAASTATDFLTRRTRLAFVDQQGALAALPKVVQLMAEVLGWDEARCRAEKSATEAYLKVRPSLEPHLAVGVD
jgi:glycerol-3-phosphate dehydrogenase